MTNNIYPLGWSMTAEIVKDSIAGPYLNLNINRNPTITREVIAEYRALANAMERILDDQDDKAEFGSIIGAEGTD